MTIWNANVLSLSYTKWMQYFYFDCFEFKETNKQVWNDRSKQLWSMLGSKEIESISKIGSIIDTKNRPAKQVMKNPQENQ